MVTLDPELDMEFVSLTFELDRYSSKPVNIGTTPPPDGRVGIRNSLLPEQVGTENLIRFSDLKKKLNQGFEMSL